MSRLSVVLSLLVLFVAVFAGDTKDFTFQVTVHPSSSNYATTSQSIPALSGDLMFKGNYTEKLFVCFNYGEPIPALSEDEDLESVCNPDNFFTLKSNTTDSYDFWVLDESFGAPIEGAFNPRVGTYYMGLQLNSKNVTSSFVVDFSGTACLDPNAVGPNCEVPETFTQKTGTVAANSTLTFELGLNPTVAVGVASVSVSAPPPPSLQGALAKNDYTLWVRANNAPSSDAHDMKVSGNSTDLSLSFEAKSTDKYYAVLADSNGSSFGYTIDVAFAPCQNGTMGSKCNVVVRNAPTPNLSTEYYLPDKSGMTYFKMVASTVVFGVASQHSNSTLLTAKEHSAPALYVQLDTLPTDKLNVGYIHNSKEVHVYVASSAEPRTWIFGVETDEKFSVWAGSSTGKTCANDCSGNGVCNGDGTCSCSEEWAGFDCSMVETSTSASDTNTNTDTNTDTDTSSESTSPHSSTNSHSHSSTNSHSTVSTSDSSSSSSGGGGLKKIYIVLIVIAAVIVLAILIGVPVACYVNHRKRLQYERV